VTARLSRGEATIVISGVVIFIGTFLPWFKAEFAPGIGTQGLADNPFAAAPQTYNAWNAGGLWGFAGVVALVAVGLVILPRVVSLTIPPERLGMAAIVASTVSAVLVLLKLLIGANANLNGYPSAIRAVLEHFIDVSRQWGLIVSSLAAIAMLLGAFARYREIQGGIDPQRPSA
jgi:hypothetical protein